MVSPGGVLTCENGSCEILNGITLVRKSSPHDKVDGSFMILYILSVKRTRGSDIIFLYANLNV
jgi:hypothetical protein